ncbi:MAG: sugar transferase [Alphaproteobacteria bacterium]
MKRVFDVFFALFVLVFVCLPIIILALIIFLQDFRSPIYVAERVGVNGKKFKMFKLRSMVVDAELTGVVSTSSDDKRVTSVGAFCRRYKLDELPQLFNVVIGNMSLVGPRPNVFAETSLYTKAEETLLSLKPGITDFSSIVFSDEGEILSGKANPNLAYNQLIRPRKSALGIVYCNHSGVILDIRIIIITVVALFSRENALRMVSELLASLGVSKDLVMMSLRDKPLTPQAPPGTNQIVTSR